MVTSRQKKDIEKLMRRIKEARNKGKSEAEIKRRTHDLLQYLADEGIRNVYNE